MTTFGFILIGFAILVLVSVLLNSWENAYHYLYGAMTGTPIDMTPDTMIKTPTSNTVSPPII